MAYDVTALGTYTQPNEKTLLVKSVLAPKTIQLIKAKGNVMTGVKSKSQLPIMDTDAIFQNGTGCGFTPAGTTKISTREINVGAIKVQEELCPSDVEASFEQLNLTAGSDYTEIIFAGEYQALKAAKIAKALEIAVWSGDKASGDAQLNKFDGFRKIIKAATNEINGNTGAITAATGITQANVISILQAIYTAMPAESIESDDAFIMMGQEVLRMYNAALIEKNLFHHDATLTVGEAVLFGTNMKMYSTPGLNGTNELYAGEWKNFYFATDLLDETEKVELKYAPEAETVRFSAKFKAGVQVAFPEEVVVFVLVP